MLSRKTENEEPDPPQISQETTKTAEIKPATEAESEATTAHSPTVIPENETMTEAIAEIETQDAATAANQDLPKTRNVEIDHQALTAEVPVKSKESETHREAGGDYQSCPR